jgi:hypothetical protein
MQSLAKHFSSLDRIFEFMLNSLQDACEEVALEAGLLRLLLRKSPV